MYYNIIGGYMGRRILGSILLLLIFIPIFIVGGNIFNLSIYVVSVMALHEFISVKDSRKEIPLFIKIISYIALSSLVLSNQNIDMTFSVDYRILSSIFILFLVPTVLYHDRSRYSIVDGFYLIGGILFLGMSFNCLILVRSFNLELSIYLFLISIFSDAYSYITGTYIGKHKLIEEVSKDKTLEGMLGGLIFGVFVPVMYYTTVNPDVNIIKLILITVFLCILGIFGDLSFSAIKRYFGKKNFSNVIVGHGGILDRFDSIIFIVLGFMFCINIIGG